MKTSQAISVVLFAASAVAAPAPAAEPEAALTPTQIATGLGVAGSLGGLANWALNNVGKNKRRDISDLELFNKRSAEAAINSQVATAGLGAAAGLIPLAYTLLHPKRDLEDLEFLTKRSAEAAINSQVATAGLGAAAGLIPLAYTMLHPKRDLEDLMLYTKRSAEAEPATTAQIATGLGVAGSLGGLANWALNTLGKRSIDDLSVDDLVMLARRDLLSL